MLSGEYDDCVLNRGYNNNAADRIQDYFELLMFIIPFI